MTLKDVAVLSNCSVATVSKAFKNSPEVSDDTKSRVLKAAEQCGYIKKAMSHTAVLGGMKTVIISDPDLIFVSELKVISKMAEKIGLTPLYVLKSEPESASLMEQTGAAGVVICNTTREEKSEKTLYFTGDNKMLKEFFEEIDAFRPKRASRAKSGENGNKKAPYKRQETPKPVESKKEEIWLL